MWGLLWEWNDANICKQNFRWENFFRWRVGNHKFLSIDNFRVNNKKECFLVDFYTSDCNFSAIFSLLLTSPWPFSARQHKKEINMCNKTNDETIFLHNKTTLSILPLKSECRIQVCLTVTKDWCSSFSFEWPIRTYSWFFQLFCVLWTILNQKSANKFRLKTTKDAEKWRQIFFII